LFYRITSIWITSNSKLFSLLWYLLSINL
jgi:hypothetical protein